MHEDNTLINMLGSIVTVVVVLTTIAVFNYHVVFASHDGDKSILPNYREGYKVGEVQGRKQNISGNEHDDGCPSWDRNILYCIGYEIGYNDGYYGTSSTEDNMTRK